MAARRRKSNGPSKLPAAKARSAAAVAADVERYLAEVGEAPAPVSTEIHPRAPIPPGRDVIRARVYEWVAIGVAGCPHCGTFEASVRRWTPAEIVDCACICHTSKEALARHMAANPKKRKKGAPVPLSDDDATPVPEVDDEAA